MTISKLVSVIIPAYNHELYVRETLVSLLQQTYQNIEIIIFNDGSTDTTALVIESFLKEHTEKFVRFLFIDKQNEGISATLNKGIALSQGEFVFIIASDDVIAEPDALDILVKKISASKSIGMVCGDADFIDGNGNRISRTINGNVCGSFIDSAFHRVNGLDISADFGSYRSLLASNYIPPGPLVRASLYAELGTYPAGKIVEDYGFWLRMSKHYQIVRHNGVLLHYRVHCSNAISIHRKEILCEVGELLLSERKYCYSNGHLYFWRRSAFNIGVHLLKLGRKAHSKTLLKLLLFSMPVWHFELCHFVQSRYHRLRAKYDVGPAAK